MAKNKTSKDNLFKSVVRDVVREELDVALNKHDLFFEAKMRSIVKEEIEQPLEKFRDEIFSHIDPLIKLFQDHKEEHAANEQSHQRFNERITQLEKPTMFAHLSP